MLLVKKLKKEFHQLRVYERGIALTNNEIKDVAKVIS